MHRRVDAVTTASYPIAHQQTTHASKPHLNRYIPPVSRGAGTDEVYREFRTNRRPLNVASVVSRTVEQET